MRMSINAPPIIDAPRTDGPVPATGVCGVGAVVVITVHVQFVLSVQLAFRHAFSIHTNPDVQSELTVHALLQPDKFGVGVGVGV